MTDMLHDIEPGPAGRMVTVHSLADETGGVVRRDDGVIMICMDDQDAETGEWTAYIGEGLTFREALIAFLTKWDGGQ